MEIVEIALGILAALVLLGIVAGVTALVIGDGRAQRNRRLDSGDWTAADRPDEPTGPIHGLRRVNRR